MPNKVRRVGNSNVLTLPKELEALGYTPGAMVDFIAMDSGVVLLVHAERAREIKAEAARRVLEERDVTTDKQKGNSDEVPGV